jgi:hypothetical protein
MEEKVKKLNFETMGIRLPEQLKGLIDNPPLLDDEDPKLYASLVAAVIEEEKPQGMMDFIDAVDQVNKVWEEWRLRRASVGLIRGDMLMALQYFLQPIRGMQGTSDLALKYFSKNPKERKQVVSLLAQYGITETVIQAKAAQLNSPTLQMFERMAAARENGRRQIRKDKRNRRQETNENLE